MRWLITGSAGHLGEGLARTLRRLRHETVGLDIKASAFTAAVGSVTDRALLRRWMAGVDVVLHAATLHKPHVATHTPQDFIDTNVTGTLAVLEAAVAAGVDAVVFTSTTSVYGDALRPPPGTPAAWITEDVTPIPKNIYGITKLAAEELCRLFYREQGLPCLVLRTSRFFPEPDDDPACRRDYADANLKANEFLYRRVELADAVSAHLRAAERAAAIGFGRYVISATTPFLPDDLAALNRDAPSVVARRVPHYAPAYQRLGWALPPAIGRVYVNERARTDLGWRPRYDFDRVLRGVAAGTDPRSPLARAVGAKGYHDQPYAGDGPYPIG